jgi:hypothetical protein
MLTTKQQATLRAVIDSVIPPDEYPGGWEAGVGDFILNLLTHDARDLQPSYAAWLDGVEAEALVRSQRSFAELEPSQQTALLQAIEAKDLQADWPTDPAFFAQVTEHCAEGFYSDPGNLGNRDARSWQMIRFEVNI